MSQVIDRPESSYWVVPTELYPPIVQDGVTLTGASSHAGARAYVAYLRGPEARRIIEAHGYAVPRQKSP
jgi:molybdate transport system substrate-binding protein